MVRRLGDVGRLIEVGTSIGRTRRDIARNKIIQFYYCVFQYNRILKTERYDNKQVVLTLSLINPYQGVNHEVVLKYGDGDISRSSWVSIRSKDGLARVADHYFENPRHNTYDLKSWIKLTKKAIRKSVRQVWMKGDYIVMSRSLHTRIPSLSVIIRKTFSPARTNWGGILGKSQVRWE